MKDLPCISNDIVGIALNEGMPLLTEYSFINYRKYEGIETEKVSVDERTIV